MPGPPGGARPPPDTGVCPTTTRARPLRAGRAATWPGPGSRRLGIPAIIRPHSVRPGPRSVRERAFGAAAVAGLLDAAGPGHAVPGGTFVPRKIPPTCAPSGDAQPRGLSVACRVTQTCTGRRHEEWLISRSTRSRPVLPTPPPSTPRSSMTDDARPAGRDRKAPADLYGMRGPRRRAHPIPPHPRWPGPRRRCGRALVPGQGGGRS